MDSFAFEVLKTTRNNCLKNIENLSDEQLLVIPQGHNNNILWNLGHIVSAQQGLCYGRAGLPMNISPDFIAFFRKGSAPSAWENSPSVKEVKELLISTADKLEQDYKAGLFQSYNEYPTSYGVTLKSIEDAIAFNNVHEGLHLGVIMALRKHFV